MALKLVSKEAVARELQEAKPYRTVLVSAAIVAALAVLLLLVWATASVLLVLFAGLLFSVLLQGIAALASRELGLGHGWALALVLAAGLAVIAAVTWFAGPRIAREAGELQDSLPPAFDRLRGYVGQFSWSHRILESLPSGPKALGSPSDIAERMTGVSSSALGILTSAVLILFFGIFLAAEPRAYRSGVLQLVPPDHRRRAASVLTCVHETLWWWLIAKFGSMSVVGVLTWIGLIALGIPLAFTLSIVAAALTFIPNLGPIISAIPAILLGLVQSPATALGVAVLFIAIQTVESYVITPLFQQRAISMPPGMVIAAQVLMGVLAGGIGLIVATPLTAAAKVMVEELYVKPMEEGHDANEDSPAIP